MGLYPFIELLGSLGWVRCLRHGTTHDDTITGGDVANGLRGMQGDDSLSGAGGDDMLDGGNGEEWDHLCIPAIDDNGASFWENNTSLKFIYMP